MDRVRVCRWASGPNGSPVTNTYSVEARIIAVATVAGLVDVAGDFVYDETEYRKTLSSLLHGAAHGPHAEGACADMHDPGR